MLSVLQNHIAKYARFLEQTTGWIPANIAVSSSRIATQGPSGYILKLIHHHSQWPRI